jgi:hypothetical protein
MVDRRKEASVDTSKTLRLLVATAVVSALAVLLTSPALAYLPNEGGEGPVAAPSVGNPGDSAWIALEQAAASRTVGNPGDGAFVSTPRAEAPTSTSSGSDGFVTGTFVAIAGGAVLVLGAAAILLTTRHRRVALP